MSWRRLADISFKSCKRSQPRLRDYSAEVRRERKFVVASCEFCGWQICLAEYICINVFKILGADKEHRQAYQKAVTSDGSDKAPFICSILPRPSECLRQEQDVCSTSESKHAGGRCIASETLSMADFRKPRWKDQWTQRCCLGEWCQNGKILRVTPNISSAKSDPLKLMNMTNRSINFSDSA